jgi:hypothetical protein
MTMVGTQRHCVVLMVHVNNPHACAVVVGIDASCSLRAGNHHGNIENAMAGEAAAPPVRHLGKRGA